MQNKSVIFLTENVSHLSHVKSTFTRGDFFYGLLVHLTALE